MASWLILATLASWLAYHCWRSFRRPVTVDSQSEPGSIPPPTNALPRLDPIFPVDKLKGETTVDIIAVHGIETTSPKTWTAYEQDTDPRGRAFNWLQDPTMLPSVVVDARIWVFDYNSYYSHNAQTVRSDGPAQTLLNFIQDRRDDFDSRRNFVFIGSCFGGIVVAEALLLAFKDIELKKTVFDRTAGVIFLGSPLRGTKAATFAGWKNFVYGILDPTLESSCTLLDDLESNSSRLEKVVADFGKLTVRNQEQAGMEIRCFYETRPTQMSNSISRNPLFKLLSKLLFNYHEKPLVGRGSACLDCHEQIPLDARHAMMNKYRGPGDPNFKHVSGRIKDVVDKIRTNRNLTRDEQKCMGVLFFPYLDEKNKNPARVKGTCEWLLKHSKFLAWLENSTANLLWITADPGCGKSVLSKALIDEGLLHPKKPDLETTTICYYFFKDDAERGSGTNALRSILHQLLKQKPWLIGHVIPHYQSDGPNIPFETLWDILMKAVEDTRAGPVICVIDALDECESTSRKPLIQSISRFHRNSNVNSPKLKFLLTSRPYYELQIDLKVDDLPSIRLEGREKSTEICEEIDMVIEIEVSRICKEKYPPIGNNIQSAMIKDLKKRNNRTYLWVHLMLKELELTLESNKANLKQLLDSMPDTVDHAYEKILQRTKEPGKARRILHLVLAAKKPLSWREMNTALEILDKKCTSECDFELDKKEAFRKKIENLCGLFVVVIRGKIYLFHQTAKEFLVGRSDNIDHDHWSWKHTFPLESSNLEMLRASLRYLALEFRDKPQDATNDDSNIDSTDDDSDTDSTKDEPDTQFTLYHPFLFYASKHWTLHFQQAGQEVDKELVNNALQLCRTASPRFRLWFRIYKRHVLSRFFDPIYPKAESGDFMVSCFLGLAPVAQLLLKEKPDMDVDSMDEGETRALSWAAISDDEAVAKLLLEKGANLESRKDHRDRAPVIIAASCEREAVFKLLLDAGADIEFTDEGGRTPLLVAAGEGNEAGVKLVLEKNPNLEATDEYGETPLSAAASHGHKTVVKLLLEAGANLEATTKDGHTPLWEAVAVGHKEVVRLLLEKGADSGSKDNSGFTLMWAAVVRRHVTICELLKSYGATPVAWDTIPEESKQGAIEDGTYGIYTET